MGYLTGFCRQVFLEDPLILGANGFPGAQCLPGMWPQLPARWRACECHPAHATPSPDKSPTIVKVEAGIVQTFTGRVLKTNFYEV